MIFNRLTAASLAAMFAAAPALAATEVTWWHAMGGELGEKLEEIVAGYNASQSDYVVTPVYKGSYTETMTGAIAAFRAGEQPAIVQVFEVGTGTMMAAEGAIYPVYQLMADHGEGFDPSAFLPTVVGYYTDPEGNMLSMPFNSSTPILYYNKDAFAKAGLEDKAPATWAKLEAAARKIIESGAAECGFTSGWPSWVQLENFSAWHNQPFGTLENGFGGMNASYSFNGEQQVRHLANLAEWQKDKVFQWGGGGSGPNAAPMFYAGDCAMYMNSSASRAGVLNNTDGKFNVGFGMLPYYDDVEGAPQNSIIGGATLWVLQGHDEEVYKGAADFFSYLSSAEVQADWHQFSGYLPITQAAYELGQEQGYYAANPGSDVAIKQMTLNAPTGNSKGLRFGAFVQERDVISEEMEAAINGSKTAQEALDAAVARGEKLLREFEAANN